MAGGGRDITVVGFGEVMLRISPVGLAAFGDENRALVCGGGSEANVLAKLGNLAPGIRTELVSAIKDDAAGLIIRHDLQKFGIGTGQVLWTNDHRNGVYFLEQGLGPLAAKVDYDRAGSAIANFPADPARFAVLDGAAALFVSGITPALSDAAEKATACCLQVARKNNVPVFFDVNYRNKLWSADKARATLEKYLAAGQIHCLITTETDAKKVFGIDAGVDDESTMDVLVSRSRTVLTKLAEAYPKCALYVLTVRKRITNETGEWTSCCLIREGGAFVVGDAFTYTILDRPGAGDSCSAGVMAGVLGVTAKNTIDASRPLAERIKVGLDLGNRICVVAQKTAGDLGPGWRAADYFKRVSEAKEIQR
ncbi:MAG: 2-dehydro-3-deoxygluconokinase [Phycisphaerae bacterium]|nr:2-dehydro-3-deoxygluconokinase [Phycisphaerae bacterium]